MKSLKSWLWAGLGVAVLSVSGWALFSYTGTAIPLVGIVSPAQVYTNAVVYTLVDQANVIASITANNVTTLGSIFQGISGTAINNPYLPVSGNSQGTQVAVLLSSGSANASVEGSLLITSTTLSNQMTVAVSTGYACATGVGIAAGAASTGSVVNMYTSGLVMALASGTVNVGDLLTSSITVTSAGYLVTSTATATGTVFAVAMSSNTYGIGQLIKVKIIH